MASISWSFSRIAASFVVWLRPQPLNNTTHTIRYKIIQQQREKDSYKKEMHKLALFNCAAGMNLIDWIAAGLLQPGMNIVLSFIARFRFSHTKLLASCAIIMIVFNSCFLVFSFVFFYLNKSLSLLNFTLNDYYQSNGRLHRESKITWCYSTEQRANHLRAKHQPQMQNTFILQF